MDFESKRHYEPFRYPFTQNNLKQRCVDVVVVAHSVYRDISLAVVFLKPYVRINI